MMFSHAGWDLVFCAFGQIGHRSAAVFSGGRDTVLEISKLVRLRLGNVDQAVLANSPGPITKRYAPSEVNVERRVCYRDS